MPLNSSVSSRYNQATTKSQHGKRHSKEYNVSSARDSNNSQLNQCQRTEHIPYKLQILQRLFDIAISLTQTWLHYCIPSANFSPPSTILWINPKLLPALNPPLNQPMTYSVAIPLLSFNADNLIKSYNASVDQWHLSEMRGWRDEGLHIADIVIETLDGRW